MNARTACLAFVLALACASIADAALRRPELRFPENPGLTDAKRPALPPRGEELSLYALEERIRETPALPTYKKHTLKAEIDGLVTRFRRAHARGGAEVHALRQPYIRLMAKMHAMLKDDPKLAADVAVSREPIWGVLSDRDQIARLE